MTLAYEPRFDPNEPRDERGRWTEGGASNGEDAPVAFVSPNVSNLTFEQAAAKLNSAEQRKLAQIGSYIDGKLGIEGSTNRQAIGAWSDGAENSLMVIAPHATHDQMVAAAVMKGDLADQKAVLVFTPDHGGEHHLLSFDVADKSLQSVHTNLLQDGLAFHTLEDLGGGHYRVHAFVSDPAMQQAAERAAERYDAQGTSVTGSGEFIGTTLDSGSDREQRDDAHHVYDQTIERLAASNTLQGYNLRGIRNEVRDYWRTIAAEKAGLKEWDESKHPRGPSGPGHSPGEFASSEGGAGGGTDADGKVSSAESTGNYGLVPGDAEKFEKLFDEWAKLNVESTDLADRADTPEALAIVDKQIAIFKEIHQLKADPGGPGGIGKPGGPRDVLIIGGGPGGLTAATHGGAEGLDTLVVEANVVAGGQAKFSSRIENYPGFPLGVSGEKLFQSMLTGAQRVGAETKLGVRVTEMSVDAKTGLKHVTLSNGEVIDSRTVIIAGGAEFKKLPFPGADGPGVIYENGKEVAKIGKGGTVCVIGGSNGAAQAALGCAATCDHVILLSRSPITKGMSAYVVAGIKNNPKIEVVQDEIARLVRDSTGNPVEVETKGGKTFPSKAVGIFAGNVPDTRWVPTEVPRGEGKNNNKLHTKENLETNIPGVFAVGDMRDAGAGRIIIAAGEGAAALRFALNELHAQKEAAGIKADKPRKTIKPMPGFEKTIDDLGALDHEGPWFCQTIEDVPPIKKSSPWELERAWDEGKHPRVPAGHPGGGQFGHGGADGGKDKPEREHPGKGYSSAAWVDDKGVIHTSSVYDAQRALFEDRKVELKQPKQVSTLIQRLGETASEMEEAGEKAPLFNLCNVSVEGTNLFCAETKGIPRVEMPVIPAERTKEFIKHLKSLGYKVEKETEAAAHLRATQSELDGVKVAGAMKWIKKEGFTRRLVISKDDYILDGHHTWAGQLGVDAQDNKLDAHRRCKVARVDISITKLIEVADEWMVDQGLSKKPFGQKGFIRMPLREAAVALDPATFRRYYEAARQFFEANPHVECDLDSLVITVRVPPVEADSSKKN